jgi:murein DD-endopeptidase MepM/ murein hydrolase activator NlpD
MPRRAGRRPALRVTCVAAALMLGLLGTASAAEASSGGAGMVPSSAPATTKPAAAPALTPVRGLPQLAAAVTVRRVGRRAASAVAIRYVSRAHSPLQVRVDVVERADGLSVFSAVQTVAPGIVQRVAWNGRAIGGLAADGRYEIRLSVPGGAAASAQPAPLAGGAAPQASPPPQGAALVGAFTFVGAIFPVRGRHDYGDAAARFGAQRAGHVHQGQDVLARCGTRLVAARGGVVIQRAFQGAAGNYLVVHDTVSGYDDVYAHLRHPAIVRKGQHVETGQTIGVVGETGDATACHLHFELWTPPGWYAGGQPIDPLATLLGWDHRSHA